jgi:hypothetical protein
MILMAYAIGIILVSTEARGQEAYNLQYKMNKGDVLLYCDTISGTSTQEMMGQEMKSTFLISKKTRYEVEDITPEGNFVIISSLVEGTTSMKYAMMDTTLPLDNLVGKRTRYVMDHRGKLIETVVVDTVKGGGMDAMGGNASPDFLLLPEKEIKTGESWQKDISDSTDIFNGKGINTGKATFTLKGISGERKCLDIGCDMETELTGKGTMMGGMEMFMEGTTISKGNILFDPERGVMVEENMDIEQDMAIALTGQQNMTIPSTQVLRSKKVLVEK